MPAPFGHCLGSGVRAKFQRMSTADKIASLVETMPADGATPAAIGRAVAIAVERPRAGAVLSTKGTRLPDDWQPSECSIAFARDRGMARERIATEAEKFRNYWTAKSGSGACKRDWAACWRNWIINATERGYGPPSYRGPRPRTDSTSPVT
jgi:hypothetical protein